MIISYLEGRHFLFMYRRRHLLFMDRGQTFFFNGWSQNIFFTHGQGQHFCFAKTRAGLFFKPSPPPPPPGSLMVAPLFIEEENSKLPQQKMEGLFEKCLLLPELYVPQLYILNLFNLQEHTKIYLWPVELRAVSDVPRPAEGCLGVIEQFLRERVPVIVKDLLKVSLVARQEGFDAQSHLVLVGLSKVLQLVREPIHHLRWWEKIYIYPVNPPIIVKSVYKYKTCL